MWGNRNRLILWGVLTAWLAGPGSEGLFAKTIAIEDEDAVPATPTPRPKAAQPAEARGSQGSNALKDPSKASAGPKVKMGEKLGFHFFVKSGFVVKDPQEAPSIGKVLGYRGQMTFSTTDKCLLGPQGPDTLFRPGDRLIVFRIDAPVREGRSGFFGHWVRNLAVLKVVESDGQGVLAEAVKTYHPFNAGDLIKPYNEEMDRWNQSSSAKTLPSEPIRCFVAGGQGNVENLTQPDFVILTAGSEQGMAEGMVLEVRESFSAAGSDSGSIPSGKVRVFYAGEGHSLAQVLNSPIAVRKGFEAHFRP